MGKYQDFGRLNSIKLDVEGVLKIEISNVNFLHLLDLTMQ